MDYINGRFKICYIHQVVSFCTVFFTDICTYFVCVTECSPLLSLADTLILWTLINVFSPSFPSLSPALPRYINRSIFTFYLIVSMLNKYFILSFISMYCYSLFLSVSSLSFPFPLSRSLFLLLPSSSLYKSFDFHFIHYHFHAH